MSRCFPHITSFYKTFVNPVQTRLPFISRTSSDLILVCGDVRAHLDCVTEALKQMGNMYFKKHPHQPPPALFKRFKLECATSGSLASVRLLYLTKTEPQLTLDHPLI